VSWLRKFVVLSGTSNMSTVLLLFENYVSHTKILDLFDLARERGT
jgi:hypothetical protein